MASAPELATGEGEPLRELLAAIEEKSKLVALLDGCIETPEPVHIQIGVKEITAAGEHLSLITAPYAVQGSSARARWACWVRCACNTSARSRPWRSWRGLSAKPSAES